MTDFADRHGVALVAGGTGGIGAAVVDLLAERGALIALTYRSNRPDGPHHAVRVELTDEAATAAAVRAVAEEHGGIHTVVYAAGPHVPMRHLSTVPPARFREQLTADAAGFFNLVHPALPFLRTAQVDGSLHKLRSVADGSLHKLRSVADGSLRKLRSVGNVVAVTTAATRRFPVRDGLSAGPKGAVEAVARALAAEEGRYGVRVNCVAPGMLTDGMAARLIGSGELDDAALEITRRNIPLRRFGTAADVAEAVAFLASDRAGFITGQTLDVDGGYTV